ncbi:MAG: GNAT family N-acetyltransferase [Candidatus Aenigmatarchaeota archaeon]
MKLLRKEIINNLEIEIFRTEPKDWKKIRRDIMKIENSAFEKNVRQDEDDIKSTFLDERSVNLILVVNREIVGYTMGSPIEDYWYCEKYLEYNPELIRKTYYIESTAILPEYQGKGLGYILREELVKELKKEKYEYVASHATDIRILKIYKKLEENGYLRDCKVLEEIERWIGNRDAYFVVCKIN